MDGRPMNFYYFCSVNFFDFLLPQLQGNFVRILLYEKHLDMKKIFILLTVSLLSVSIGLAQQYAPWDSTQGPLNFNTLTAPYVRLTHGTGSSPWPPEINQAGINQSGSYVSHKLITTQGNDPCRCYGLGNNNGAPYVHEANLPPDWTMNTSLPPLDTAVMVGCNDCSSSCLCTKHSQIEYWFYPTVENSTLLVMFTFAEEDVSSHCAYGSSGTKTRSSTSRCWTGRPTS